MKDRDNLLQIYDQLYEVFRIPRSASGYIRCFYCGLPADTLDHVPPISKIEQYRAFGLKNELLIKVTSCRECNTKLGTSLQLSLVERYNDRQKQMEKEFEKYLKMPHWGEEELSRMGKNMRSKINTDLYKKELLKERAYFREGISAFLRDAKFSYLLDEEEWCE